MQPSNRTIIDVHQSTLKPKFTTIGYGNPRYNSMVVLSDDNVIISCGVTLRKVDLINNQILYSKQIGSSQIFNILQFQNLLLVVTFQGLISILNKQTLDLKKQFSVKGKQIRHSSIQHSYIAFSLQLNSSTEFQKIQVYSLDNILSTQGVIINVKPIFSKLGHYFFPQLVDKQLIFIQYNNPNPKGRLKKVNQTVQKMPITSKIMSKNLQKIQQDLKQIYTIKFQGQIICTVQNYQTQQIFYLHQSKKLTILCLNTRKCQQINLITQTSLHCIQAYLDGILFSSKTNQLTHLKYSQQIQLHQIKLKVKGLVSTYSLKTAKTNPNNIIFFNENGLHYYDSIKQKTQSQHCFQVTNCGLSINKDSTKFAVGDFGGNIYIFTTDDNNIVPQPLITICLGVPVRSLVWCHDTNNIIVGCLGGYLYCWDGVSYQYEMIFQANHHNINIVRNFRNFVIFGTSNGYAHILSSTTLKQLYSFQAHIPIHYSSSHQRQLFGTLKNYAQIWSIIASPTSHFNTFTLITCSQDQTQKVFKVEQLSNGQFNHTLLYHLKGHLLAVTSIDLKLMDKNIGQVFASCSDDQIIRLRNPQKQFQITHQIQTTSIKQWHTLTYLTLEPNGYRLAIGSQSGYLFIFNIYNNKLLFSQKIHLGGIQGMDWINNKLITCSSDLCICIINL